MKAILLSLMLFSYSFGTEARTTKAKRTVRLAVAQELVNPPVNNEVCFSPDEPCARKLALFIASAEKTLDVAIYDINQEEIVHQILVKSKKIKVRVVVDQRQSKGNHSAVELLRKAGVSVRLGRQRGVMHDKFVIVDGQRLETGSFNYTAHASEANQENQVYLSTPEILGRYRDRFEKIWSKSK